MLITRLFQPGNLLVDNDGDGLLDGFGAKILIDPRLNFGAKVAMGNLAARLGHELAAYDRSEFYTYNPDQSLGSEPTFLITPWSPEQLPGHAPWEGVLYTRGDRLVATGGRGLAELLTWLAYGYPYLGGGQGTSLEKLLDKKQIAATRVIGLVVGHGRLRAVLTETGARVKRIPIGRALWPAVERGTPWPAVASTGDLTDLLISRHSDTSGPELPLVLAASAGGSETLAACHLALRFGFERAQLQLPLVMSASHAALHGPRLAITASHRTDSGARLHMAADGGVELTGDEASLEAAARYLGELAVGPGGRVSDQSIGAWQAILDDLADASSIDSAAAWVWGVTQAQVSQEVSSIETEQPLPDELIRALQSRQSQPITLTHGVQDEGEVREFSCDWEVDALWAKIRAELPTIIQADGCSQGLQLQVFVSEPHQIRMEMQAQLQQWISAQWDGMDVQVFSGYKPGFSWISEGLLPKIVTTLRADLHKVKIYYEQFEAESGKQHLELPSRWLQELYPIDEVIAQQIGLKLEEIEFVPVHAPGYRYRVEALNAQDSVIGSWSLNCCNGERPYLDRFPEAGLVKTFTSWVALEAGEEILWSAEVPSDLERVWDQYQSEVLPWLEETLRRHGSLDAARQPFFHELSIELFASEEDTALGIREERLSPLEAMHEEFYFTTLDWFARLGSECSTEPFRKPGAVVPWMRKRPGQPPTLRFTLRRERPAKARVKFSNGRTVELRPTPVKFAWRQVDFASTHGTLQPIPVFDCEINDNTRTMLQGLQALESLGPLATGQGGKGCRIRALANGSVLEEYSLIRRKQAPATPMETEPLRGRLTSHIIDYPQLQGELQWLDTTQVGRISTLAKSISGRGIDVIEMVAPQAKLVARAKLVAAKPTYLVLSRHHANEVSSTNAALLLTKALAEQHQALLRDVNVVIIPMENPDGAELHASLAQEAPTWKHHSARFNALGEDLSAGYFQEEPTDPGSKALTRAWQTWTPDVVGDNHGVPSHEWEQPFSGYVCPWFATFWMPRAFYYGIFTYLDDPQWPEHRRMAEHLRERVADRMAGNQAMLQLNSIWRDRYLKYAHRPCPTKFPYDEQEYCQGMLAYCSGRLQESKFISAARRFPDRTVLWWIDEVNDETAHGDYLGLCIDAHLQANLTVLETLVSMPSSLVRSQVYSRHGAQLSWSRPRPLNVAKTD